MDLTTEDRLAIQDLCAHYAWALDTGDVEGVVACFAPDGVVIEEVFEDPDRWEGHEGIRRLVEHYRSLPDFPGRQHHISQLVVEGNRERARARSFAFVTECRGEPPYVLRFTGYYEDVLVRRDGVWLFAERTIRLWDGPVLRNFPGRGERVPRRRPAHMVVKKH